ncbi:MAG: formimidoylglutamase [Flavobacteriaceae bacterium]|jgi:formiminoglutamase|nr:formimidoylglutamase [Flavobacteriaceae bacterium]
MLKFPDKNIWSGRLDDEDGELGLRWHQVVKTGIFSELSANSDEKIALLGFCSDEGVRRNKGRIGAKEAPDQIRKALANLPFDKEKQKKIFDFGDILLENDDLEAARKLQIECVSDLLKHHYLPIVLGGGHETALGNYLGLTQKFEKIGIINIDAHFDLRIPVENSTSGTPFFEMAHFCAEIGREFHYFTIGIQENGNTQALFKRANELNTEIIRADEVHIDLNHVLRRIEDFAKEFDAIYLSLDLDVLDGAFAPGVSAPSVNGLTPFQVKSIIQKVVQTKKLKLFDVVELNPNFDQDNRTAKLAAHFIQEINL